jgi:hypothetical protein
VNFQEVVQFNRASRRTFTNKPPPWTMEGRQDRSQGSQFTTKLAVRRTKGLATSFLWLLAFSARSIILA